MVNKPVRTIEKHKINCSSTRDSHCSVHGRTTHTLNNYAVQSESFE